MPWQLACGHEKRYSSQPRFVWTARHSGPAVPIQITSVSGSINFRSTSNHGPERARSWRSGRAESRPSLRVRADFSANSEADVVNPRTYALHLLKIFSKRILPCAGALLPKTNGSSLLSAIADALRGLVADISSPGALPRSKMESEFQPGCPSPSPVEFLCIELEDQPTGSIPQDALVSDTQARPTGMST